MYSSSSELDILLKAALDALGAASNIAWVFYEMYGSSSDVTGPGTLVMWILSPIIVVLFTVHILKRNIGARSNGFHTMLEAFPVTGRSSVVESCQGGRKSSKAGNVLQEAT